MGNECSVIKLNLAHVANRTVPPSAPPGWEPAARASPGRVLQDGGQGGAPETPPPFSEGDRPVRPAPALRREPGRASPGRAGGVAGWGAARPAMPSTFRAGTLRTKGMAGTGGPRWCRRTAG
ncbi:hypothetical protein TBS_36160 [Thermobispora bispora]